MSVTVSMADPTTPDNPFQRVLDEFKAGLSAEEKRDFEVTTLKGLKQALKGLQDRQRATGAAQNMPRVSGFLKAMSAYGEALEVFVGARNFGASVWVGGSRLCEYPAVC
jgi:hypothetical protein